MSESLCAVCEPMSGSATLRQLTVERDAAKHARDRASVRIAELEQQVAVLEARIAELEQQVAVRPGRHPVKPLLLTLAGTILSAVIVAVATVISAGLHMDYDDDPWDVES